MTDPNPYEPPLEQTRPLVEERRPNAPSKDERRAHGHAAVALGLALCALRFHPLFAAIAIFLAWRAMRLAPWPSAPAKLALVAIGLSVVAAVLLGPALWG